MISHADGSGSGTGSAIETAVGRPQCGPSNRTDPARIMRREHSFVATRNRHNLAQRAIGSASCSTVRTHRVSGLPDSEARGRAASLPRPKGIGDNSKTPQINLPAIQRFILSAPPAPIFPVRLLSRSPSDSSGCAQIMPGKPGWTPYVISTGLQVPSARSGSTAAAGGQSSMFGADDPAREGPETAIPESRDIRQKARADGQDPLEGAARISSSRSKSNKGRSPKTAVRATSRLRAV